MIRANPQKYIDAATDVVSSPKNALRKVLRNGLAFQLKLRSADELKPQYVSNITAETLQMASPKLRLLKYKSGCLPMDCRVNANCRRVTNTYETVQKAMILLDTFGPDVSSL